MQIGNTEDVAAYRVTGPPSSPQTTATQKVAITAWWEVRGDVIGDESRVHRSLEKRLSISASSHHDLSLVPSSPILQNLIFGTHSMR